MAQIEKLKTELVPDNELKRVKAQLLAQEVFEKDSMAEQAILLGALESIGLPWSLSDEFIEKINAVTPLDIQQVVKKYFNPMSLTMAELVPEKLTH
jgi:zinc protease